MITHILFDRRECTTLHFKMLCWSFAVMCIMASLLVAVTGHAAPAPNLPLPPCDSTKTVNTCNIDSDGFSLSAGGRFTPGGSVSLEASGIPVCISFSDSGQTWSPSPCYSSVGISASAGTCYYIDLRTDTFASTSCGNVLYKDNTSTTNLITLEKDGGGACSSSGNFYTYFFGGPANVTGARYSEFGPDATECQATFNGARPNNLLGPTWIKARVSFQEEYTLNGFRTSGRHFYNNRTASVFIPIDGDLRNLGVIAKFTSSVEGRKASFSNLSIDPENGNLTYNWDFGDGKSETSTNPSHIYDEAGTYTVRLVARDADGNEDDAVQSVAVTEELVVKLTPPTPSRAPKVGEETIINVDLINYETSDLSGLSLDFDADTLRLEIVSGPNPALPSSLAVNQKKTVDYRVKAIQSGEASLDASAQGTTTEGLGVSGSDNSTFRIPVQLELELTNSVESETRAGDDLEIYLKITNNESITISGITVEALGILPNDMLSAVGDPTVQGGGDPRVNPFSLAAGASTTVTFKYRAEQKGVATISAFVAGNDPNGSGRVTAGTEDTLAIESAAIKISNLRMTPEQPTAPAFVNLRGTVTNKGSVDVTELDVTLSGNPDIEILQQLLADLDPSVTPRIATLASGESRDFIVPVGVLTDAGLMPTYQFTLQMQGNAEIDSTTVSVTDTSDLVGVIDRNTYWTTIQDEIGKLITQDFQSLVVAASNFIDKIGDSSTLGGINVGTAEGAIGAFQKLGDGLLTAGDIAVKTVNGDYHLTDKGKAIMQSIHEYRATRSNKQMLVDLANLEDQVALAIPEATIGTFADWMFEVDTAYSKGDAREVSRLIAEPTTTVLLSAGGEAAVAKAFAPVMEKIIASGSTRLFKRGLNNGSSETPYINLLDPSQNAPPLTAAQQKALAEKFYNDTGLDIGDIPTGVPLSKETVARAGIADDEYIELVDIARRENTTIYARPRPAEAAEYAKLGYNAKPMPVKIKSITDIDAEWLGYPNKPALVPLKEPLDPYPALKEALESGRFDGTENEFYEVIERYHLRKAEWEEHLNFLDKANSVKTVTDADGNLIETYKGIKVKIHGREVATELYIDGEGLLRYSINNRHIYSDIDIYYIGEPGGPISLDKYNKVSKQLSTVADQQHGTTANSVDFPNQEVANKFIDRYGKEHMRGTGEPVIIIGPDATTFGYVDRLEFNPATIEGSNEQLYNQLVDITFEGDNIGAIAP